MLINNKHLEATINVEVLWVHLYVISKISNKTLTNKVK